MLSKILRTFWILSLLLFLGALILLYSFLPSDGLRVPLSDESSVYLISHEYFFWGSLMLVIVTNGLFYLLYRLLMLTAPASRQGNARVIRHEVAAWFLGLAGSLNLFFIFAMSFLVFLNRNAPGEPAPYGLLVWAGPLLILAMFAVLAYIFMRRRA